MSACIVWRCGGVAPGGVSAFCERHAPAQDAVRGPVGADAGRWADLLDPDAMAADVAAHNAQERTLALVSDLLR